MKDRIRIQKKFEKPSRTKASEADSANLSKILDKMRKTGFDPFESRKSLTHYFDCSKVPSFEVAMNTIVDAQNMFDSLPSNIRSKFDNDVTKMGKFVENASEEELQEAGLLPKSSSQKPAEGAPGTVTPLDVTVPDDTKGGSTPPKVAKKEEVKDA
jgi:hypothetical protein